MLPTAWPLYFAVLDEAQRVGLSVAGHAPLPADRPLSDVAGIRRGEIRDTATCPYNSPTMMALAPGTRLGPYEVTAQLGAGGMGEVYRARDTKLGRDVALKVLPDAFAHDRDRLARFRREAHILASLNHPNIAHIYGLEDANGMTALVMELVHGPTLADLISRGQPEAERASARPRRSESAAPRRGWGPDATEESGPAQGRRQSRSATTRGLAIDDALAIARQIAEALESAHEQGVIHRDLKPANVKVRPDGTVKVLDFGLAKALDPVGASSPSVSQSPTITSPAMTEIGMILGTAAYLSPEQARGKAIDKRADIWAFGCVLYEMLTGQRAFRGDDVSDTLAAVLRAEVQWDALPAGTPTRLRRVIALCLQRDPKQRARDVGDVRLALDGAFETTAHHTAQSVRGGQPLWRRPLPVAGSATLAAVFVTGIAAWGLWPTAEPRMVRRFTLTVPSSQTFLPGSASLLAISPDGQTLAYRAFESGRMRLYRRALDRLEAEPIADSDGTNASPFFSADSRWIWFASGNALMKSPVAGGRPVRAAEAPTDMRGATWTSDGTLILGMRDGGLLRVPATGEEVTPLAIPEDGREYWYPQVLPHGRALVFTASSRSADAGDVLLLDLTTGARRTLVGDAAAGWYAPTGHLVFLRGGDLWATRFDLEAMEVTGDAIPIERGIRVELGGAVQFAVADDGSLVYLPAVAQQGATLLWVDLQRRETLIPIEPRPYRSPRLSPDGTRIAVSAEDRDSDLWTVDVGRRGFTRVTTGPALDRNPVWTADGQRLIFQSQRHGPRNLFWQSADGTGAAERLIESPHQQSPSGVSPDGRFLVFHQESPNRYYDVMLLALDETRRVTPLVQSEFDERNGVISPDGRWIAYQGNDSGPTEIYVRPFPDVNANRWKVSAGAGKQPLWSRKGQALFYVGSNGAIMRVGLEGGPAAASTPTEVVREGYFTSPTSFAVGPMYDVSADGQRFLVIKDVTADRTAEPTRIVIVQHWFEELKRLLPVR